MQLAGVHGSVVVHHGEGLVFFGCNESLIQFTNAREHLDVDENRSWYRDLFSGLW